MLSANALILRLSGVAPSEIVSKPKDAKMKFPRCNLSTGHLGPGLAITHLSRHHLIEHSFGMDSRMARHHLSPSNISRLTQVGHRTDIVYLRSRFLR
jgi:hypothetical protein